MDPSELRNWVEAALFMAGKPVKKERLSRLLEVGRRDVQKAIDKLGSKYGGPIVLRDTGEKVVMTVEDKYMTSLWFFGKGEFSGAELKTLAMVAYYAPVKQSDIARSRGNRAYKQLSKLEDAGLITSEKMGNTKLINLSRKFFEYFGEGIVERIRASQAPEGDGSEGLEDWEDLEIE